MEKHSVVYAVQVLGLYEKYSVQYLAEDGIVYREETPKGPIWQTRLTGQFYSVVDLELQVQTKPVKLSSSVPVPPPKVSCGIVVDGAVRASQTWPNYSRCTFDLETLPYSPPAGGLNLLPFLFPLAATAVAAFVTIRAYRRRPPPTSASPRVEPAGYERRPHLKYMVRCGQMGVAILAVGLLLSFWLDTPLTLPQPPKSPPVRLPLPDWPQNSTSLPGGK